MRRSNDPILTGIARGFRDLSPFPAPWPEYYLDQFEKLLPIEYKGISRINNSNTWRVRLHIGGKALAIAFGPENRLCDLCRYRDMVEMRLWKYRAGRPGITENDLIFSPDDISGDLKDFEESAPFVLNLIDRLENHLIDNGTIRITEAGDPANRRESKSASVKNDIFAGILEIERQIEQVSRRVERMEIALNRFLERQEQQTKPT